MPASINNNLMAANVANNLNSHYGKLATSVERLSSGLRINSAADDAAGLAIRELMRADVATLNQGMRNANDAISMIQVADGALGIIDEKLIRMKELAEQAATGTYSSIQRLMIDSEFQAMASEIERIARATDFNGIKLLDGSLKGEHDGSGLNSTGKLKVHFGSNNDSAEDYYYVEIGDCTLAGLGLRKNINVKSEGQLTKDIAAKDARQSIMPGNPEFTITVCDISAAKDVLFDSELDVLSFQYTGHPDALGLFKNADKVTGIYSSLDSGIILSSGKVTDAREYIHWGMGGTEFGNGGDPLLDSLGGGQYLTEDAAMLDIEFISKSNMIYFNFMLATSEYPDWLNDIYNDVCGIFLDGKNYADLAQISAIDGQTPPAGLSGPISHNNIFNKPDLFVDNRVSPDSSKLIDESIRFGGFSKVFRVGIPVTPGVRHTLHFSVADVADPILDSVIMLNAISERFDYPPSQLPEPGTSVQLESGVLHIHTQEQAQKAITDIDAAIVKKDKVRAHLGALQNRLENTVTNLSIQIENLKAADSRISDTDVSTEMTAFVRNQVLTQSAVAMLGQANSYPHMLSGLITS